MTTEKLLMELSSVDGPTGYEDAVAEKIREILGGGERTKLGGLIYKIEGSGKGRVGVFAHIDEIGMLVSKKAGNGFFYLDTIGGVDPKLLPSSKVKVLTKNGVVRGVIGIIAPHLTPPEKKGKVQEFDEIVLDATMSDWQSIEVGDRVVVDVKPSKLGELVTGKALDDRAGCVSLIKTKEFLEKLRYDWDVYLVFSTREEHGFGSPGASSIAYELDLDWAIVVDVTIAEKVEGYEQMKIGEGPAIGIGPFIDKELHEKAVETAKRHGIKHQIEVLPMRTGTDNEGVRAARTGTRTLLISIPLKYMHTPVEVVDPKDVEETARIMAHLISEMEV